MTEEKIKYLIPFHGKSDKWRDWKTKFVAQATMLGFREILLGSVTAPEDSKALDPDDASDKKELKARRDNERAYSQLVMSCHGAAMGIVEAATTKDHPYGDAHLAWENLKKKYEPTTRMSLVALKKKFNSCRLEGVKQDPDEWIQELFHLQRRIEDAGGEVKSEDMMSHILANLPDQYSELITTIETELESTTSSITTETIQVRLRAYFERKFSSTADDETEEPTLAMYAGGQFKGMCRSCGEYGHKAADCPKKGKGQFKGKCHYCGKIGHKENECFKKKRDNKENNKNTDDVNLVLCSIDWDADFDLALRVGTKPDVFLCDSGATSHMTNNKEGLLEAESHVQTVTIGNGKTLRSKLKGSIKTKMTARDGSEFEAVIKDVLYVPQLVCNLLSVGRMSQNAKITYEGNKAQVEFKGNGKTIDLERLSPKSNVYGIELTRMTGATEQVPAKGKKPANTNSDAKNKNENTKTLPTDKTKLPLMMAHGMLGHCSHDVVRKTMTHLGWKPHGTDVMCVHCAVGKAKQKNVKKQTENIADAAAERLFLDISSSAVKSAGGRRHWALIVDDHTRMKWSRFLKHKSELNDAVLPLIKQLLAKKLTVKKVRMDNAGENLVLAESLKPLGIDVEFTAPDTPQQNGVVERAFAVNAARGRAMMAAAGMSEKARGQFWAECFNTATVISNIVPFQRKDETEQLTPFERFYGKGKRPKWVEYMHVFGQIGYMADRKAIKNKLGNRAFRVMFLGYAEDHEGDCFRVYKFKTRAVVLSRDIRWTTDLYGVERPENVGVIPVPAEGGDIAGFSDPSESVADDLSSTSDDADDDEDETNEETNNEPGDEAEPGMTLRTRTSTLMERLEARSSKRNLEQVEIALVSAVTSDIGEPATFREAVTSSSKEKWETAIRLEYENMKSKNVWHAVKRTEMTKGVSALDTKWVFKVKPDGRHRARLVVRGYTQIPGVDFTESHSPVANDATIRSLLIVAFQNGWCVEQLDVETAFLYGELKEEVYLRKPEGFDTYSPDNINDDEVLRLDKACYGLVQASRTYLKTSIKYLTDKMGLEQSLKDPCLLVRKNASGLVVLGVVIYVDDILMAGPKAEIDKFIQEFGSRFSVKAMGDLTEYVGANFKRTKNGYVIDQHRLINKMVEDHGQTKSFRTPAAPGQILLKSDEDADILGTSLTSEYRSVVGKLLYLVKLTRPDMASAVRELSKFMDGPTEEHMKAMHRAMGYLAATKGYVLNVNPTQKNRNKLVGYTDSNWASDKDTRRRVSGHVIYYSGALVSWRSKMQQCVTLSSTEAEYVACSQCVVEMEFLRQMLESMGEEVELPMTVYVDNTGAIDLAKNWSTTGRTKHIDIRFHYLREMSDNDMIDLIFVPSEENHADMFTKNLGEQPFGKGTESIGVGDTEGVNE